MPAAARLVCLAAVLTAAMPVAGAQAAPRPDLVVARVAGAPATAGAGDALKLTVTARNATRAAAPASAVGVWLSADARRDRGDEAVGRAKVARLKPRGTTRVAVAVSLPRRAGAYRLLVCADAGGKVAEANESNNCVSAGRLTVSAAPVPPVTPQGSAPAPGAGAPGQTPPPAPATTPTPTTTPPPAPATTPTPTTTPPPAPATTPTPTTTPPPATGDGPNLVVRDVSDPPASVLEGSGFAVIDEVANARADAPATVTRFYLTPDAEASFAERRDSRSDPRVALGDVLLGGSRDIPALGAGESSRGPDAGTSVVVPVGTSPGVYQLIACADDRGQAGEASEDDNCTLATHPEDDVEKPSLVRVLAEDQEYRVDSLSDDLDLGTEAADQQMLEAFRPGFCANPSTGSFASVPQAVDSIKAFLADRSGADAMAQFAASPEYQSAGLSQAAAGDAIAAGRPGAALAALIRAHELEPQKASHLANAAAVASSVGLPAQALALLDGARRLDDPGLPAMGISRQAVALANRGQALAMLGRFAEADAALDSALAAEPLLAAEAETTKSATTVCRSGAAAAVKHRRKGKRRQPPPPLDGSHGRSSSLRDLPLPAFPKQAATMKPLYQSFSARFQQEITANIARRNTLDANVRAKDAGWSQAQRGRYYTIMRKLYGANREPDLDAQGKEVMRLHDLVFDTIYDFWGEGTDGNGRYQAFLDEATSVCEGSTEGWETCFPREMRSRCRPALKIAHQTWLDQIQDSYDAAQSYYRALSKRMSGYAAHLADEDTHARALLSIKELELSWISLIEQPAFYWTHNVGLFADYCVEAPEASSATTTTAEDPESPGACTEGLKAASFVAELGPTKLKVNCEKVTQSIKWEAMPWLQAFGEISYDPRAGKLTVLVGSKGEIAMGVAKGAFKSGIYLTADSSGIKDVGWRVGPSATVTKGAVEIQTFKDEIDLSFVGAVSSTFGL